MQPELSVVIVNWNSCQMLRDCLNSLFDTSRKNDIEVIVIDNASIDDSIEMCRRYFPYVNIIINNDNVGYGQASNQGIKASKAELILILNTDTLVLSDSLEGMIRILKEDSSIGLIGCRNISPDGTLQPSCMNYPNLTMLIIERLLLYKLSVKLPRTAKEPPYLVYQTDCDWVSGACIMMRKKAIEKVGFFDPKIWMYGEEMELEFRIKTRGWRIIFDPTIYIIHKGKASWREKTYSPTFPKNVGMLYFIRKHFSISIYLVVRFLFIIGALLRIIIWGILFLIRKNGKNEIALEIKSNLIFLKRAILTSLLCPENLISKRS